MTDADRSPGPDRACVLADPHLYEWQAAALDRLVRTTDVKLPLVVVNAPAEDSGYDRDEAGRQSLDDPTGVGRHDLRLFWDVLTTEGPWAVVLAERKLAWLFGLDEPGWERRRAVEDVDALDGAELVRCEPVDAGGAWNELPDPVVDRVVDETDVVVRFGFGLLTGRILEEPAYGTLSFHPADVRRYRGLGPSQNFLAGDDEAGATLQRLSDEIDGGEIVAVETVDVSDAHTLDAVEERVEGLQVELLARGVERLADPSFTPEPPETLGEYAPLSRRSEPGFAGRILVRNLLGRVRSLRD